MGRPLSTRPTDAEFEILCCFWRRGTATIRDIHDDLLKKRKVAYTSVATIVRIMVEKGYMEIVDPRRPQRFKTVLDESETRRAITDEWANRMCGGSIAEIVRHAIAGRRLSKQEREEIKALIQQAGRGAGLTAYA